MKKQFFALLLSAVAISTMAATPHSAQVNTKDSQVKWEGKKVTGAHNGKIQIAEGKLDMNKDVLTGGSFKIDMNSISCDDLTAKEWNDKLVGHLKADDFFGTEKYPFADFVITSAKKLDNDRYDITGNLTIKGKTNEVTFPATVKANKNTVVAVSKIKVDRTKYDIKYGSKNFIENIGDKAIEDDFTIDVNLVATR